MLQLTVIAQLEPLPDDIVDPHLIKSVKLQAGAPDNTHWYWLTASTCSPPPAAAFIAMVARMFMIPRRRVRRTLKAARQGAETVHWRQSRLTHRGLAPSVRRHALSTEPTVSPLKCLPNPENEMFGPQPTVLYRLTDTRSEMGVDVRKRRGIESYFSVSLGVAWQRQRVASKVVG